MAYYNSKEKQKRDEERRAREARQQAIAQLRFNASQNKIKQEAQTKAATSSQTSSTTQRSNPSTNLRNSSQGAVNGSQRTTESKTTAPTSYKQTFYKSAGRQYTSEEKYGDSSARGDGRGVKTSATTKYDPDKYKRSAQRESYLKQKKELEKSQPAAKWLGAEGMGALTGFNAELASTVDFFLPPEITPKPVQDVLDYYKNANKEQQKKVEETRGGSWERKLVGTVGGEGLKNIPVAMMTMLSGGANIGAEVAGKAVPSLMKTSDLTHVGNTFSRALNEVANTTGKNPMFWETVARTLGTTYEKEIENGADPVRATLSAYANALLNAQIEVGGGIEIYDPSEDFLKAVMRSAKEEGLEEVQQYAVENLVNKAIGSNTAQWLSLDRNVDAVINPLAMAEQGFYGALSGGLLSGGRTAVANAGAEVRDILANPVSREAVAEGMADQQGVVSRGLVQKRGEASTKAQTIARELQRQLDNGEELQPNQVKRLIREINKESEVNEARLGGKVEQEVRKSMDEGSFVEDKGTTAEKKGVGERASTLESSNIERAKTVLGENATDKGATAVGKVSTGTATSAEIDTVLASPTLKSAVETLVNEGATEESEKIHLPINNREARMALEDLVAIKKITNRNTLLRETQENRAEEIKDLLTNLNDGAKDLFAKNLAKGKDAIGDVYQSSFYRMFREGTKEGADFNDAYNRLIAPLGAEVQQIFTRDFAQQIFAQGKASVAVNNAKATAKNMAEKYANRTSGISFENNDTSLVSKGEATVLDKLAKASNVEIRVVKTLSKDGEGKQLLTKDGKKITVNGKYVDGTIYIASDTKNKLITVAKHELTHYIKEMSPERYKELEDFILKKWYNNDPEAMAERIEQYQRLYKNSTPEEAREELIADASEAFFTDEGAIEEAVSFSEKLGKAIHDCIKNLLDAFTGDNRNYRGYGEFMRELGILRDAERMWAEALGEIANSEVTRTEGKSEAKNSLTAIDEEYMEAVESGDMEKAQKMVDERAYTKNYVAVAYHGTPNGGFTVFGGKQTRNGAKAAGSIWFAEEEEHAKAYRSYPGGWPKAENPQTYRVYLDIGRWADIGNGRVEALDYSRNGEGDASKDLKKVAKQIALYTAYYHRNEPERGRIKKITNTLADIARDISADFVWQVTETKEFADLCKEQGLDSVVAWEEHKGFGEKPHMVKTYGVFDASQIKDASPVTYDDNGNVIPLSERFNEKNEDIRYSLEVDSEGDQLSTGQAEYFKNSKVRDEDGNLLKVYHGTDSDFTVFDSTKGRANMDIQGSFFSPWEIDAGGYGSNVGQYYLNITNPADEGTAYKALNMFKGQNEAGVKARDYLISKGYDGVNNSNEEYIAFYPEQIKRIDNLNPTTNPDIRYSITTEEEALPKGGDIPKSLKKWAKDIGLDTLSEQDSKVPVSVSVRDLRSYWYTMEGRDSEAQTVNKSLRSVANALTKLAGKYKYIGLGDAIGATVHYRTDENGNPTSVYLTCQVKNAEYEVNYDFTTICAKRAPLQKVLERFIKTEGKNTDTLYDELKLDEEGMYKLRLILEQAGFEVSCIACFVEQNRYAQQAQAKTVADDWNKAIDQWAREHKTNVTERFDLANIDLKSIPYEEIRKGFERYSELMKDKSPNVEEKNRALIEAIPYFRKRMNPSEYASIEGQRALMAMGNNKTNLYNLLKRGQGYAKQSVPFVAYNGEVALLPDTMKSKSLLDYLMGIGGARAQSASDFQIEYVYDYMQMVADLSARKLPMHMYTKVIELAELFGKTGIKINLSAMCDVDNSLDGEYAGLKKVNGKYVYNISDQSIDYKKAVRLQRQDGYSKNIGIIMVTLSKYHMLKALSDKDVRYIIGYHSSKMPSVVAKQSNMGNATDYTKINKTNRLNDEGRRLFDKAMSKAKGDTELEIFKNALRIFDDMIQSEVGKGKSRPRRGNEYSRYMEGYKGNTADFDVYEDIKTTNDPRKTADNYIQYCLDNDLVPMYFPFAFHENYYKCEVYDFNMFDNNTGEYAPMEAVQNIYPDLDMTKGQTDTKKFMSRVSRMIKAKNEANEALEPMYEEVEERAKNELRIDGNDHVDMNATGIDPNELKHRADALMDMKYEGKQSLTVEEESPKKTVSRLKKENATLKEAVWKRNEQIAAEQMLAEIEVQKVKRTYKQKHSEYVKERNAREEQEKAQRRAKRLEKRLKKQESTDKTRLLKLMRRLDRYKTTEEMKKEINSIIGDFDLVSKGMLGKTFDKISELEDTYERMKEDPDFIPDSHIEDIIKRIHSKHIKDLTLEETRSLIDVLSNIENELRTSKKLIDSEMRKEVKELGLQVMDDIKSSKGLGVKKQNFDRFFVNGTLSPLRQIRRITGYVDNDPLLIATKELEAGQRKMLTFQMNAWKSFDEFMKDKKFLKRLNGRNAEEIEVTGEKDGQPYTVKITPDIRMALYLSSMNEDNLRHMNYGGVKIPDVKLYKKGKVKEAINSGVIVKFSPSQLREIASHMTKEEKAFATKAYEFFNVTSPNAINEVSEQLKGYSLARVKNYYPIHTDDKYLTKEFDSMKFDGTIEGMGFLKERVLAYNPILMTGLVDTLTRSIDMTSKYVGLAIPVRNFNKLYNMKAVTYTEEKVNGIKSLKPEYHGSVKDSLSKWGDSVQNYIEKFMTDLQNSRGTSDDWEKALNKWRSHYAGAVLTLNASVAMKQAASFPTAGAVLGFTPLLRSMGNIGKVDLDLIAKYTPLQWYRSQGFSTTELGDINANNKNSLLNKVPALNWIQGMDLLTTRKLWKASEYYVRQHNKALKVGTDEYYKAVAEIYNRVIEETQPNYTTMQRPALLRSDSSLVQVLNMFKTQPYQNFNILYDAIGNYNAKRRQYKGAKNEQTRKAMKQASKDLYNATWSQVMQLAVFAAMTSLWQLFRRKDDKYKDEEGKITVASYMHRLGLDMVNSLTAEVPFGSDIYGALSSALSDEYYYGFSSVTDSSITDLLDTMTKSITTTGEWLEYAKSDAEDKKPDSDMYKDILDVAESASRFLGIPFANIKNTVDGTYGWVAKATDGEYIGRYKALKMTFGKQSDMMNNLFNAYRNDKQAYEDLRNLMIEDGIAEDKIDSAMKKKIKEKPSEEEEANYQKSMGYLESNSLWDMDSLSKESYEKNLRKIALGIEDSDTAPYTKYENIGITPEENILIRLAMEKADKTKGNANGYLDADEKKEALKLLTSLKLSDKEKEAILGERWSYKKG